MYKQECNLNKSWIIIFFFILVPIFLFSQVTTSWVARYDGPISSEDVAYSMVIDEYSNVYVTGWSNDLHSLNIARDCASIKYDTDGNELWVERYSYPGGDCGDWCYDIALDPFGNVCVTGAVQSAYKIGTFKYDNNGNGLWGMGYQPPSYDDNFGTAISTDPTGNVYVAAFSCNPECGYRLIKYDHSSGDILWDELYNYGGGYEYVSLAIGSQKNFFIAGQDCECLLEYLLMKYDEEGNFIWKRVYDSPSPGDNRVQAITIDDFDNIYVTGQSMDANSNYDFATIKYNNNGDLLWVSRYDGTEIGHDEANAIAVDNLGNVFVTGISEGDYATVKYDSDGIEQWVARYDGPENGSDKANDISLDNLGNVYVTGISEGDYATIKYNPNGVEQWVERYDGPGNGTDYASSIAVDSSYNVYVSGKSMGSGTDYDFATIKYVQGTGTYEEEFVPDQILFFQNYPNPFNPSGAGHSPYTTISFNLTAEDAENAEIIIYNFNGQKIKTFPVILSMSPRAESRGEGQYSIQWDAKNESGKTVNSGTYFYRLCIDGKTKSVNKCLLIK